NEYFAVNLILRHRIKLTAKASVVLVLPLCGMPLVDKKVFSVFPRLLKACCKMSKMVWLQLRPCRTERFGMPLA
ncbi:MAG: hypothetical protein WCI51_19490, partial [Lentisphaerota bacterium]